MTARREGGIQGSIIPIVEEHKNDDYEVENNKSHGTHIQGVSEKNGTIFNLNIPKTV